MKFAATFLGLAGSAAVANAASFTFWTLDDVTRTIYFTSNENQFNVAPVTVNSGEQKQVTVPDNFVGNFYAVQEGAPNAPGMLGEVQFGGWNGATYFDVSGIVNLNDKDNVKQMWPMNAKGPVAGCETFPCNYYYVLPDDKQTWVTNEVDLMVTLGNGHPDVALNYNLNPTPF